MYKKPYSKLAKALQESCHLNVVEKLVEITRQKIEDTPELNLEKIQSFKAKILNEDYFINSSNIAKNILVYGENLSLNMTHEELIDS